MLTGVLVTWIALGVAYFTLYSIGFYVTSIACAAYLAAHLPERAAALGRAFRATRNRYNTRLRTQQRPIRDPPAGPDSLGGGNAQVIEWGAWDSNPQPTD